MFTYKIKHTGVSVYIPRYAFSLCHTEQVLERRHARRPGGLDRQGRPRSVLFGQLGVLAGNILAMLR